MNGGDGLTPEGIIERLSEVYGYPYHLPSGDPIAELVLTVLSQNTSDSNSGRAFVQLMRRFESWDAIAEAPEETIAEAIQVGGLARQKAPRIKRILGEVKKRSPGWDLGFLSEAPLDEARGWLRSLPGVGPKTAACVLLFALNRPAMPVDTHVERVAKRLGIIPANATGERAHALLEAWVPSELFYPFHMSLIKHGRRTCHARRPRCGACVLAPECPSALTG